MDPRGNPRPAPISPQPCSAVGVSAAGATIVLLEPPRLRLFSSPQSDARLLDAFPGMMYVDVSPRGEWFAGGNWRGKGARVWDAMSGSVAASLLPDTQSVNVRFSPDGNWLATGSSDNYRLWRTGSWRETISVPRPRRFSNLPGQMDFSPDSRLLAVQVDQMRIRVLRVENGEPALEIEMPEPLAVVALRFSGDGRRLAVAASTNQVFVWDLDRIGEVLRVLGIDAPDPTVWPLPGKAATGTDTGRNTP